MDTVLHACVPAETQGKQQTTGRVLDGRGTRPLARYDAKYSMGG